MENRRFAAGEQKPGIESLLRKRPIKAYFSFSRKLVIEMVKNAMRSLTPKTFFFFAALVLVLAILRKSIKDILLVSALAVAASYSTIYKRTIRIPSAVELVTLGTVVTGVAYGPGIGAAFGVLTTFASEIISSGIDAFTLFYAVARGVTGAVVFYLSGMGVGIIALGMIGVAIFNVLCQPVYQMSGDIEQRMKGIYYFIVNTLFNLLVFKFLGNPLLRLARL